MKLYNIFNKKEKYKSYEKKTSLMKLLNFSKFYVFNLQ